MDMFRLLTCLCSMFLAVSLPGFAQGNQQKDEIARGQIIEKVICENQPDQSYAVYLPGNYDPARKWPILYAFDPVARGKLPVERYKEAAEKFGWIVAGSNNSRNASWKGSFDAWNAITADTHKRFSIDNERIYATGFSGGARVAVAVGVACDDCLAGVIASGAGFPPHIAPSAAIHFAFFGTVGANDFNFPELKELEPQLNKVNIENQLLVFDGGHEWPPPAVATEALAWMELQAMKSVRLAHDESRINAVWNLKMNAAQTLESAGKIYDAYLAYTGIGKSFKGLHDVTDAESKTRSLENTAAVRDALRDEQQQIKKQRQFESQIASFFQADAKSRRQEASDAPETDNRQDESLDPRIRLRQLLTELRRQSRVAEDSGNRRVARRVLDGQYIGLIERGTALLQDAKEFDEAVRIFTLANEVNPDRAGPFYYLAWAYAGKGDKKKALQSLKTAIEKGFADLAAVNDNKIFDSIRTDKQFAEIIGRIKKP